MVNLADGRTRYVDQRGRFVDNGELVPLRDALQASASIPIAYPPMTLPGGRYVDGGVRENVPIRIADEASASSVIAILASPVSMSPADFSTAVLPAIAARSAEALYDEVLQADIAPRGGFRAPRTIIAPDVEPYSLFTVDPGLIRIPMDYGYMRAFDEMHANVSVRGALRDLSTRIFRTRKLVWGPLEHRSEGALMKQEIAGSRPWASREHRRRTHCVTCERRSSKSGRWHCSDRTWRILPAPTRPTSPRCGRSGRRIRG
jgi:NTE family protein